MRRGWCRAVSRQMPACNSKGCLSACSVEEFRPQGAAEQPLYSSGIERRLWDLCTVVAHFPPDTDIAAALERAAEWTGRSQPLRYQARFRPLLVATRAPRSPQVLRYVNSCSLRSRPGCRDLLQGGTMRCAYAGVDLAWRVHSRSGPCALSASKRCLSESTSPATWLQCMCQQLTVRGRIGQAEAVVAEEWVQSIRDSYRPSQVAERLWIVPDWCATTLAAAAKRRVLFRAVTCKETRVTTAEAQRLCHRLSELYHLHSAHSGEEAS